MNSGKIVAGRVDGTGIEGSIKGPRGPKKFKILNTIYRLNTKEWIRRICGKVRRPLVHHFIKSKYKIHKKSEKIQNTKYNIPTKYKGIDWENLWESKKTIGAPLRPVRRSEHISLTQTHSAVDAPCLRRGQV